MADDRYALVIDVDARRGRAEVRGLGQDMQRTGGQASRLESGMAKFQSRIVALGGTFAGIQLARKVIDIAASFETLRVQLETVEGSAMAAGRAFDQIKAFAARTPFQVQALTESWINLRSKGFEPTIQSMTALGNLAAAFGKDVTQATQAVTQAAFGEAEMLKQFGIIMRVEGDKARITFKGVTREIERDSKSIVDALIDIAETNFAGGMERQAETFNGRVSTMKDALANLADSMAGNGGILDALSQLVLLLTQAAEALNGYVIAQSKAPKGLFLGRPTEVDDDYMAQLRAFIETRKELADRHREVIESETGVRGMLARFENSKIAAPFQALEKALEGISPTLDQIGKDFDALRDVEIFDGAQKMARVFSQTPIFSPGGVKDTGLDPAVLAATAEQFPQIDTSAGKAAKSANRLADALERANKAMGLGSTREALDAIDRLYQGYLDRVAAAGGGFSIEDIQAGEMKEFREAVKGAVKDGADDGLKSAEPPQEFASAIARAVSDAVTYALGRALRSGDVRAGFSSLFNDLIGMGAQSITKNVGAMAGNMFAVVGSVILDGVLGMMGGNAPIKNNEFLGSVTLLGEGAGMLVEGSRTLRDAALEIMEAGVSIRESLLSFEFLTGGGLGNAALGITEQSDGQIKAVIGNVAAAYGDSIAEATRNALDEFARNIPILIGRGRLDTAGMDPAIAGALRESSFANFADMTASLQTWNESLNAVATTLGAVTPATDATLERLRQMELAIIRSGLSAERAAPFLGEIARAMDIRRQQIEANTLTELATLMERAGINAGKAAAFRAQAEQKITQLKILELEITARQLGLWTEAWAVIFGQLNAWAANINNFTQAAARIVAPVVSSPVGGGGGGGGGGHSTPNQDRLNEFLESLHFTSPGTPIASKTALNAAIAAMQEAAASNDADAFIAASQQALQLQSALYGSLGMAELIAMIEDLGQFTPEETENPVVAAIGGLGSSISSDLSGLGVDITGALDTVSLAINEDIGAKLIDLRDNNRDGMIGIREAQGLMTDATFQLLDVDQNGFLSLAELSSENAQGIFDLLDVNRDGNLTLEELLGTVQNPPPPPPRGPDPITPEEMEEIIRDLRERLGDRIARITGNQSDRLSPLLTQISDEIQRPQPRFDPTGSQTQT